MGCGSFWSRLGLRWLPTPRSSMRLVRRRKLGREVPVADGTEPVVGPDKVFEVDLSGDGVGSLPTVTSNDTGLRQALEVRGRPRTHLSTRRYTNSIGKTGSS